MDSLASDSTETRRLLAQVREGDRSAINRLLTHHRPYLRQLVGLRLDRKLRARVDPSDVVQEAQIEASRRLDAYLEHAPMPFRLWLRQLAYDRLLMMRRRHCRAARRAVEREVNIPDRSSLLLAQQLQAHGPTPSQQLDREELAQRVRSAVAQLPDLDREVLILRTFEGLSFEEVSYLLGVSAAAARKRHGRALLRLHEILTAGGLSESQA
jgi:RNA polymerase sigma-70 factor (ECF subfamily)